MQLQRTPIQHRLARFILWLSVLLAWFAAGAPHQALASQRHRRRYSALTIEKLTRAVRNIIVIRAAQLLLPYQRARVQRHANAPIGFRQATPRQSLRTVAGSALRRTLRSRGSFIQRVLHLIAALRRVEALAARLAHRRRSPFTRLRAITPIAPPRDCVRGACRSVPVAADSS